MLMTVNIALAANDFKEDECIQTLKKSCIEQGERIIDGFKVNRCWKYEERYKCVGKEQNYCDPLEKNRGCIQKKAECRQESQVVVCKHFEKQFVCGLKANETEEIKLIDTDFEILKDEKDLTQCSDEEKNKYCDLVSEDCVEKGETRNINGKDVYKDCWLAKRQYLCRTDSFIDECKDLKNKCKEVKRTCVHQEQNRCEHFVLEYMCEEKAKSKVDCSGLKFCVGGVCKEQIRNKNSNFSKAIANLSVLNAFQDDSQDCACDKEQNPNCEVNQNNCRIFSGKLEKCRKYTGEYNCCTKKGLILHVASCKDQERDLQQKREAGLCHYIDTWKGKNLNWWKQKRIYCCFHSKLARIIQEGGRSQLGISWGNAKNPNCRALTLDELQRIDFEKINFDDISHEIEQRAKQQYKNSKQSLSAKLNAFKTSPSATRGHMETNMNRFKNAS